MRAYLIPYLGVRAAVDKNLYYFVVASFRSPIQGAPPSLPDIYSEVLLEYSYTDCSNIFNYRYVYTLWYTVGKTSPNMETTSYHNRSLILTFIFKIQLKRIVGYLILDISFRPALQKYFDHLVETFMSGPIKSGQPPLTGINFKK